MEYLKVLVVHRQASFHEEVGSTLKGFEPILRQHYCGIDGLQAAKLEHFDLIVCGIDLPLITGFEMVRSIRNLSRNSFTPVVFIADTLRRDEINLSRLLGAYAIAGRRNVEGNLEIVLQHYLHHRIDQSVLPAN